MSKPNKEKLIEMIILIIALALGLFQEKVIYLVIGAVLIILVKIYFKKIKQSDKE